MQWDTELYDSKHKYVAEYGKNLLEYVPADPAHIILDVGCGTGSLTSELTQKAARVIGVDGSEEMIAQARKTYPSIEFQAMDACRLAWTDYFDCIFSNAVFHWIPDHDAFLNSVYKALKNKGTLVCEFGAFGNIAKIQAAFQAITKQYQYEYASPFFFPTVEKYEGLLTAHGFHIELLTDFDRPTQLDGAAGLRNFMQQFFASDVQKFSRDAQSQIFEKVENLLRPELWNGQHWIADYRRIRVVAFKEV
ncbi:MAG: class I SAM-dependent methyltransferase [Candidatus Adiutrix sp.]|jgi:trans-aconitate methyltransferase|nr:class I SAM-dependent methyltransferase [Candidatus Adiutrix sp.]